MVDQVIVSTDNEKNVKYDIVKYTIFYLVKWDETNFILLNHENDNFLATDYDPVKVDIKANDIRRDITKKLKGTELHLKKGEVVGITTDERKLCEVLDYVNCLIIRNDQDVTYMISYFENNFYISKDFQHVSVLFPEELKFEEKKRQYQERQRERANQKMEDIKTNLDIENKQIKEAKNELVVGNLAKMEEWYNKMPHVYDNITAKDLLFDSESYLKSNALEVMQWYESKYPGSMKQLKVYGALVSIPYEIYQINENYNAELERIEGKAFTNKYYSKYLDWLESLYDINMDDELDSPQASLFGIKTNAANRFAEHGDLERLNKLIVGPIPALPSDESLLKASLYGFSDILDWVYNLDINIVAKIVKGLYRQYSFEVSPNYKYTNNVMLQYKLYKAQNPNAFYYPKVEEWFRTHRLL